MKLESEEIERTRERSNSPDSSRDRSCSSNSCSSNSSNRNDSVSPYVKSLMRALATSQQQPDSFLVCDGGKIMTALGEWNGAFPNINTSFELRWNALPEVLQLLSEQGCRRFLCRNRDEVRLALQAGLPPSKLALVPPSSPAVASHLKHAHNNGVGAIGFETEADLDKIALKAPGSNVLMVTRESSSAEDFDDLMRRARLLGLEVVGVVHKRDDDEEENGEEEEILRLRKVIAQVRLAFQAGRMAGYLGMRSAYLGEISHNTAEVGAAISACLSNHFGSSFPTELEMSASWSRGALVADSTVLCARIIGKREYRMEDGAEAFTYVLNDGVFGSFGDLFVGKLGLDVCPLLERENSVSLVLRPSDLWGCSGDDLDVLATGTPMLEAAVGEWLVFLGMGSGVVTAHSGSAFSAREAPEQWKRGGGGEGPVWVVSRSEKEFSSPSKFNFGGKGLDIPAPAAAAAAPEEQTMTSVSDDDSEGIVRGE